MEDPSPTDPSPSQVLLVDARSVGREELRHLFEGAEDLTVAEEAQSGEAALTQVSELHPDLAVVNVALEGTEGMSGVALTRQLQDEHPDVGVLVVSEHEDTDYVKQVMQAGADGYVLDATVEDTLTDAARTIADGDRYLDPILEE